VVANVTIVNVALVVAVARTKNVLVNAVKKPVMIVVR
tara:strand:- start:4561 stop:4671 length:111 start_codon:yes stop_codon:yes gene_type:complete